MYPSNVNYGAEEKGEMEENGDHFNMREQQPPDFQDNLCIIAHTGF